MDLSTVFSQWRTFTPRTLNRDQDQPFTIQYKLVSKNFLEQLDGWSSEELSAQVEKRPKLKEAFGDLDTSLDGVQKMAILLHDHTGSVDQLTVDGEPITTSMELFEALPAYAATALAIELQTTCVLAEGATSEKKTFGQIAHHVFFRGRLQPLPRVRQIFTGWCMPGATA